MTTHPPIPEVWQPAADLVAQVYALEPLRADIDARFAAGLDNAAAVDALAEAGLLGLTLPRRYGGQGRDYTALAAVCEALGSIDTAHQIALTVHLGLVAMAILQWGNDAQRNHWLPLLARGEVLATFGLTEPGAGSDVGALRASARRVAGGYLLNGEKTWISGANHAGLFIIFATIDPALRHRGITAFLVPRSAEGLSTSVLHGKFGVRAGDTGSVSCSDVFVSDAQVLGEVGEGFALALAALGNGLFTVGAGALGIAAETRRIAAAFMRSCGDDGRGWAGGLLAQMVVREEAARLLLARAAALKDAGRPNTAETGRAKWQCAEAGLANAVAALDIWQARHAVEHPALLRHWANAKGAVIYGGTSEIHQAMQAAYALGDRVERLPRRPAPSAAELAE